VCIYAQRNADTILFHHEGGVDIGDVDAKVLLLGKVWSSLNMIVNIVSCMNSISADTVDYFPVTLSHVDHVLASFCAQALKMSIPVMENVTAEDIQSKLLVHVPSNRQQ
jgi:hypothetical protein